MKPGLIIKQIRREKGMKQMVLAELAGIKQSNLSRIESGLVFPRPETQRKLAEALGVPPAEFFNAERVKRAEDEAHSLSRSHIWWRLERLQGDIAAEIRVLLGEDPYPSQLFDDEQRKRRVESMKRCAAKDALTDEARHQAWMKQHFDAGWTWGPEFRPDIKQHPNLLAWPDLLPAVRSKARIFNLVAQAAADLAGG